MVKVEKTINEATVWKYYYVSHDELAKHLQTFVNTYNFARKLKTLIGDHTTIPGTKLA